MPIWAIDLDGLEEKIVVYKEDNEGKSILIKEITYEDVADYGPPPHIDKWLKQDASFNIIDFQPPHIAK